MVVTLLVTLLVVTVMAAPAAVVRAQDPPPAVGTPILEDPLSGPTLILPFVCPNQRAGSSYVGEGLRLVVTGGCNDGDLFAGSGAPLRGLTVADGEVRVEVKVVGGIDRARININVRSQPMRAGAMTSAETLPASYAVAIEPGAGRALIGKVPGGITERTDLHDVISADDWNTIAIRVQGENFWLLVNDQPLLFATDDSLDRGLVSFGVLKMGDGPERSQFDPSDPTEVAVVARNLRVSALADGDPERVPTYHQP